MEKKDFAEYINRQNWIFAKTYAGRAPHEYIVKDKLNKNDMSEFLEIVIFIRHFGFPAIFWGQEHIYYYYEGYYYWTMGNPVEETIILNRCNYKLYEMCYSGKGGEGCL